MKKILFIAIVFLSVCSCETKKNEYIYETDLERYSKIYDLSGIDIDDIRPLNEYGDGWLYNKWDKDKYDVFEGYKYDYGDIWFGIFDKATREMVFSYTDNDAPKEYTAYGETHIYNSHTFHNFAITDNYVALLMRYSCDTKQRLDAIVAPKDNETHKRVEDIAPAIPWFGHWNKDILYYYNAGDPTMHILYDLSTQKIISEIEDGSFLRPYNIYEQPENHNHLLSKTDDKHWYIYAIYSPQLEISEFKNNEVQYHEYDGFRDSIIIIDLSEGDETDGDQPNKYESVIVDKNKYRGVIETTVTTFSGKKTIKTTVLEMNDKGEIIVTTK